MMSWYGGGMGYGAWMLMGLFWLALLGVIIWAVVRLLPARRDGAPSMLGKVAWLVAIWLASVAALGLVAGVLRVLMSVIGLTR